MSDVLIVYANEDRTSATRVSVFLQARGFSTVLGPPLSKRLRKREEVRPDVLDASAVVVIWSNASARLKPLLQEAEIAAATGKLIGIHAGQVPPTALSPDLAGFVAGPLEDTDRLLEALRWFNLGPTDGRGHETGRSDDEDETALADRAWAFVDGRGDPMLIQRFIRRFPGEQNQTRARARLAELAGADEPDGNANRPLMALLASVAAGVLIGFAFFFLMPKRATEKIYVAAAGADGIYARMISNYNEYLKPMGLELVAHEGATSSFTNVQLLADGKVQAAFIKGGTAGALRDPDFMTDERMRTRGEAWQHNWSKRLDRFHSLGRVALEPLWVFTYGSSELNKLAELSGEPIHVGSLESGTRTIATMLLERNRVRFKQGMWLEEPLSAKKIDEKRPLGEARALFLLQPAETQLVQALLKNVAPEQQFDKSRVVRTAIFGPIGRRIALALGDNTARILNAETGQELALLKGHTDEVNDIAFSPDGELVATAGDDDSIRIWKAETGEQIAKFEGSGKDINSVAFSPDGKLIVSSSDSDRATIREVATGNVVRYLSGHEDDVNAATFSPDGRLIVTGSRDHTAIIWDVETGKLLRMLGGHEKAVSAATFSPDGRLIVTSSWDGTARIWDVETGRQRLILSGHTDIVRAAEFSPDGKRIITASWDDTAKVWDVATGTMLRTINGLRSNVNGVGFSPDGKLAMTASQDSHIRLWDVATWANLADFTTSSEVGKTNAHARHLYLMNFEADADAYLARYPFMSKVQLPRGAIALEPHAPPEPVTLLATSVAFVVDKVWAEKNKSAVRAITDAIIHRPQTGIDETTRKPRMFFRSGQFPSLSDPEFEVSPLAPPIYKTGDVPFLLSRLARMEWVSFSMAASIDEHAGTVILSLIPLLGILIPLIRAIPAIYTWTVRRRLLYWYHRLQALERRLDFEDRMTRHTGSTPEIERIDNAVSKINVPLAYSDQYYDLRAHIELVRQRLEGRTSGARSGKS